jgi:hypothetical protein
MGSLHGTFGHFLPVQILRLLQMTGSTGRLEVVHGDEKADLYMVDGRYGFARTTGFHVRVGDVLVDRGELRPEAVELTAAVQQDQPGARIGKMLVDSGILDPERLRAAVLEVQKRIVCRVLMWTEGSFAFHPGDTAGDEDITLNLDLDRLMVDALRYAESAAEQPPDAMAA